MRAEIFLLTLFGLAQGSSLIPRDPPDNDYDQKSDWHPKTHDPHFFNIKVDDKCTGTTTTDATATGPDPNCPLQDYAIRLEKGIAVATPYNRWWDPKLPTFFVDDDTQLYTVSREPLQLYVDAVTGALKYTKVGWLPPSAISISFYHTGNNPLGLVGPSPAYLTWPSTFGITNTVGQWIFCPLGSTGQYQVFVNNNNFEPEGVNKDFCPSKGLAAVNANPWKSDSYNDNGRGMRGPPPPPPPPRGGMGPDYGDH